MVNKKGWLRIVEASIAIMIIFGILLVVNNKSQFSVQNDLTPLTTPLLEEVARNVSFRNQVITQGSAAEPTLRDFVATRITQSTIKFDVAICDVSAICNLPSYPVDASEVYAGERIISGTLTSYQPKKIKIFLIT